VGCKVSGLFGLSGQIELRNSDDLSLQGKAFGTSHAVTSIAFSPDGTQIAATVPGSKSPVLVYKTDDQTLVCESGELPRHKYCDIAFSPKGTQICAASNSGAAVLLHGQTAKMIAALIHLEQLAAATVDEFGRPLGFVRFSPDGQSVLTACGDRTARLWKAETGQPNGKSMIHKDHVTDCCFSPDGKQIGTSCLDGTAGLWNVSTGNTTAAILRHTEPIHAIEIRSDGKILTASEDRMARTWSYHSPTPIAPADGIPSAQSVISADGGWIALNFRFGILPTCRKWARRFRASTPFIGCH
jgi:WD40 repeat protein